MLCWKNALFGCCGLRFVVQITYLFSKGKLWETKGTFGHYLLFHGLQGFTYLLAATVRDLLRTTLTQQPLLMKTRDGMKVLGGKQITESLKRRVLARMHNWVTLVMEVIRAELPSFEAFSSMATLLQLEGQPGEFEVASERMGKLLTLPSDSWLH